MFFFFFFTFFEEGRSRELEALDNLYKKSGFNFAVIYGRRRVGKTALINQFIKNKKAILYTATEQNNLANLKDFSSSIFGVYPDGKNVLDYFPSWDKTFEYLAQQSNEEKIVLAIDEFPYLANANRGISSVLQKHIDTTFKSSNIMLILCGSSMSFMERQVLGYKSPLYGRRNAQLKIEPFDYYDSAAFFENTSFEDKILGYAVTGGIPQYLREINGYNSISEGIKQSFFNKFGSLYEEPQNLLKQELREPAVYNTIIASIANGASKLNDISTKSGEENKKTSKYLTALIQLGIIERELPVGGIGKRNGVYRIKDNMYRFWYKFVPENVTNIESGNYEYVYKNKVEPFLSDYVGRIFEDVCRQFMLRENTKGKLPFVFDKIGRWWGTNPVSRNQEEIDVMAVSKKSAIFCECKWKNELMDMTVLNELKRKAKTFGQYSEKYFYLFSKSGFKSNLTELSKTDDHICLICLADLF